MHIFARFSLILAALLLPSAGFAMPIINLEVVGGSGPSNINPLGTSVLNEGGDVTTWTLTDAVTIDGVRIDGWSAQLKDDPFVTNNITVTNTSLTTQSFIATVLLPIPLFAFNEVINSSVGVTATDSDGNGTLLFGNTGATPIFQGTATFNSVITILSLNPNTPATLPLTTASCPVQFPGCTATSSAAIASLLVSGTADQIGITLSFDLSAGDSAGLTSRFEVVPEPGTGTLLALGLTGIAIRRQRARA
jgi:hypothetical protein